VRTNHTRASRIATARQQTFGGTWARKAVSVSRGNDGSGTHRKQGNGTAVLKKSKYMERTSYILKETRGNRDAVRVAQSASR
jgi:hypothetical protein